MLSIGDEHARESLLAPRRALAVAGGPPKVLRMDNGPELVSQALQQFCKGKVGSPYIPPGTPPTR
jgi:DNA-directed RNA polymerase subunit K/omega